MTTYYYNSSAFTGHTWYETDIASVAADVLAFLLTYDTGAWTYTGYIGGLINFSAPYVAPGFPPIGYAGGAWNSGIGTTTVRPAQSNAVGSFSSASGSFSVARAPSSTTIAVQGTEFIAKDVISVGAASSLLVKLNDGAQLSCGANTTFAINQITYNPNTPASNSLVIQAITGVLQVVTGAISAGFQLITPTAAFGTRGTTFTVTVTSAGTTVLVTSGVVLATVGTQTYTIPAGESMLFPLGGIPVVLAEAITSLPLRAGKYQYVVTYLRSDGQESGASRAGTIELYAPGGISMSSIPVSSDPTVTHKAIYVTPVNGETLFRVGVIDNATTTFVVREIRMGASPLMTQFLSPPPAGQFIGQWKGWMLVAKGNTLYVSEPYAPELFDLRKSYPFSGRITMVAPLNNSRNDGVWIGTENQVVWLEGESPETWKPNPATDYGVIPGTLALFDGDLLGNGSEGGDTVAMFATTHGLALAKSDGSFTNVTQNRFAYPVQERGAGIIRRHRGTVQYVTTMQGTETAGNVAA